MNQDDFNKKIEPIENPVVKIEPEELKKIQDIKASGEKFMIEFGALKIEYLLLDERKKELEDNFSKFKKEEKNFMSLMDYKYGNVILDIETGVISSRR